MPEVLILLVFCVKFDLKSHARVLYFLFDGNTFILLHWFAKKSDKTPTNLVHRPV